MGGHILFFTWPVCISRSWERKERGRKNMSTTRSSRTMIHAPTQWRVATRQNWWHDNLAFWPLKNIARVAWMRWLYIFFTRGDTLFYVIFISLKKSNLYNEKARIKGPKKPLDCLLNFVCKGTKVITLFIKNELMEKPFQWQSKRFWL
jgi:hypothetical protein